MNTNRRLMLWVAAATTMAMATAMPAFAVSGRSLQGPSQNPSWPATSTLSWTGTSASPGIVSPNLTPQGPSRGSTVAYVHQVKTSEGTLTYGWRPFASDQERQLGAKDYPATLKLNRAEMARLTTSPMTPASTTSANPIPLSASGCDLDTCIDIIGTGYFVHEWTVTGYWYGGLICTTSKWWHPINSWIRVGTGACGGAGVFFSVWYPDRNFSYGQSCNTWSNAIPGKPCEWITA